VGWNGDLKWRICDVVGGWVEVVKWLIEVSLKVFVGGLVNGDF
jgi:hypothetical protein